MISVLFVDDEEALLHLCQTYLERSNDIKVDIARSVMEADDKLIERSYDAIVCDYQMPWRTGLDMLKRLRLKNDHTPFIMFTDRGNEDVVIDTLNSGADYYVTKGGDAKAKFAELEFAIRDSVHEHRWDKSLKSRSTAFEESTTATVITDVQFRIMECNDAFQRLWGLQNKQDAVGLPFSRHFQCGEVVDVIAASMNILGRWEGDFTAKKADEATFIAHAFVTALHGGSDHPIGYLITLIDASKLKEVKPVTKAPQIDDQFRLIAECSGDWLTLIDSDGKILYASPSAEKISGYSSEELKGKVMDDFIHPEDVLAVTTSLRGLFEGKDIIPFEYRFRTIDGAYIRLEAKVSIIIEGDDQPIKIMFQNRDVAHRIPISPIAPTLVEVSSIEAGIVPGVAAESINETQGDEFFPLPAPSEQAATVVLASMAGAGLREDDLETLEKVKGMTMAEMDSARDEDARTRLKGIAEMLGLVLAHIHYADEYAQIGKEPTWSSVQGAWQKAIRTIDPDKLHVQVLAKRFDVLADPLLPKVFHNLLEFSIANDPEAHKAWVTYEQEENTAKLIFEDNGGGVPEVQKSKIFNEGEDKFHGLAISREILRATGISIIENGVPGKGLRFELSIPLGMFKIK